MLSASFIAKKPLKFVTAAAAVLLSAGTENLASHSESIKAHTGQVHALKLNLKAIKPSLNSIQETSSSTNAVAMPTDDAAFMRSVFMRSENMYYRSAVLEELDSMIQNDDRFKDLYLDFKIHFGEKYNGHRYMENFLAWGSYDANEHMIDLTKGDRYGVLRSFLFTPKNKPHVFKNKNDVVADWQKNMNEAENYNSKYRDIKIENTLRLAVRKSLDIAMTKVDRDVESGCGESGLGGSGGD